MWFLVVYRDPPRHSRRPPRPPWWAWLIYALALAVLVTLAIEAGWRPR